MKDYNIVVNFQDGSIESNFMELVQNDYNTTTLNFKFDTDNRVLFKMLYPDNETEYIIDIENNQLVLGPGILSQDGIYKIELASYPTDGRVTAYATMEFYVRKELISTDEIVEPDDRVPILDNLINEVDNINISATKEDDVATITVTKKDGTTDTVEIYDGEIGPQGPKGDKGDKGDTGERGPQGIQGPKGDTGPQGAKGDKGDKGDTGSQGPIGPTGPTGPQGSQGPKGDKGDTGSQGPTGPQGPQGPKGDPGLTEQEVQDMIDTSIEALGEIGFTPTVVEELPTHDIDEHTIYLVPKEDEETDDVYDEWLYISNNWEHVGSTSVDLSDYYTKDNIYGVPTFVVDFKGVDFQNGGTIYNNEVKQQCEDAMNFFASKQTTYGRLILINCGGGEKVLELTNTTRSLTARTTATYRFDTISTYTRLNTDADANRKFSIKGITINGSWNGDVFTIAQNGANKIAIEYNMENYLAKNNNVSYTPSSDYNPATKKYVDDNKGQTIQYTTMPTAADTNVGQVAQYIGTTDSTYTNGYFYQVVSDGGDPAAYSWEQLDVQPASGNSGVKGTHYLDEYNNRAYHVYHIVFDASGGASLANTLLSKDLIMIMNDYIDNFNENAAYNMIIIYCHTGLNAQDFVSQIENWTTSKTPRNLSSYDVYPDYYMRHNLTPTYTDGVCTGVGVSIMAYPTTDNRYPLLKNNTRSYTPTGDYNPATKKYVDDITGSLSSLTTTDKTNLVSAINEVAGASGGSSLPLYEVKVDDIIDISQLPNSADFISGLGTTITDAYKKGYEAISLLLTFTQPPAFRQLLFNTQYQYQGFANLQTKPSSFVFTSVTHNGVNGLNAQNLMFANNSYSCSISWDENDVATVTRITQGSSYAMVLSTTNTQSYTPTQQYHPATKKYVDDAIASAITDALGGSY